MVENHQNQNIAEMEKGFVGNHLALRMPVGENTEYKKLTIKIMALDRLGDKISRYSLQTEWEEGGYIHSREPNLFELVSFAQVARKIDRNNPLSKILKHEALKTLGRMESEARSNLEHLRSLKIQITAI